MTADVQTKYMLHSFPYLGKDDSRPAGMTIDNFFYVGKSR